MLKSFVRNSLRLRYMVLAAALALVVVGVFKLPESRLDLLPEFAPPVVHIQTEALGLSATEVEQLITVPLEADLLNGVAWLDTIRSESIPSVSSIYLTFLPGTDIMDARQMVQEKLTQAHGLPNVSKPPAMLQPVSSTGRVLQIGLRSDELSLIDLSVLARWNIRPRLMGIPGVAHVSIWGQRKRQLQVHVDPERLRDEGVSLRDIVATTGNSLWVSPLSFLDASYPGTGGFIDTPNQRLGVRHVLPIVSPEGLGEVMIEGSDRRLGEVVQIVESHQPLIGDAIVGDDSGLMLVVEKFPWANTVEVTRKVEKALQDLAPGLQGVEIDTEIFRPASFVEQAASNISLAWVIGLGLAVVVLFAFFLDWRLTLIATAAMVTSLLAAWFVLFLLGQAIDMMVIAGIMIALGVIVHDAISATHHIRHALSQPRPEGKSNWAVIVDAYDSSGYGIVITLLMALPLLFVGGVLGAFLAPVAANYSLAVAASFIVALTLTPALSLLVFPKTPPKTTKDIQQSPLSQALAEGTEKLAAGFSTAANKVYIVTAVALVALLLYGTLSSHDQLLPELRERNLLVQWTGKAGISQPEMTRVTSELVKELRQLPGVENVGAHVGRAVASDKVVGVNSAQVWVSVAPDADYEDTLEAVEAVVDSYPGMDTELTTYSEQNIMAARAGESDVLTLRLYGQDSDVLSIEAQKLQAALEEIDGVAEIDVKRAQTKPTVEIRVDLARAKQYGIKPGDVRRAGATLLSGLQVGSLFEDKKVFDVIVWGTPETRSSLTDIENLLIQAPDGRHVRLKEIAEIAIKSRPTSIKREGVARYLDAEIDIEGRGIDAVAADIEALLETYAFPMEYHAEVMDNFRVQQDWRGQLLAVALATLIGVLLVLQSALRSWRLAAILVVSLPVAVLGGLVATLLLGTDHLIGEFLGLLLVVALAVRLGLALYLQFQSLERNQGMAFGAPLVTRGVADRTVPTLATLSVTTAAVLPFALMTAADGMEVLGPMAIVVIGGLISTLALVLFVLPVLYLRYGADSAAEEDFEDLLGATPHAG